MRILYQMPGDVSSGPLGAAELERRRGILQQWAGDATEIEVADSPGGPLSIESHAEELLCVPPMLRALHRRSTEPDAMIVGCFGDPGLAAVREVLECPAVGPFEASFATALQLGARVGVVTVIDNVIPLLDHLVMGMGLSSRYAGTVAVDVPVLDLPKAGERLPSLIARAAERLIETRDAHVLILGCMSMAFQGVAEQVGERCGLPVVNPARCAVHAAEALAAQGLRHSRRTFPRPRKPLARMEQ